MITTGVLSKASDIASASVPDTLAALHVNPDAGLTQAEVQTRRKESGYNEVAEVKERPIVAFLRKFWGISAWMLELIMILSLVLRKYSDLIVVSALLIINAVLSFLQERRAAGVVEALRRQLQVSARVLRDASWQVVPARELVPGDIVRVRSGDVVPADIKLLTGALAVDQSALTGESKEVNRAPGEALSSGSVVRRGEGNGVVLLTGAKTYFGRTTELVQQAQPKLHIEAVVSKLVRWMFLIVGCLLSVVIVLSLVRHAPLLPMVPLLLVLLMSAVPVALPVMFTVSMAVGAKELAKRGVLVTRLSAAEDAATMDVLCVDKTGTITMNRLAVIDVMPQEGSTEADVLFAGALASQESNQDPIDLAFLAAAKSRRIFENLPSGVPVSFAPFDAQNRRTEAVVEQNGQRLRVMKGAVSTIAAACGMDAPAISVLEARVDASAAEGYRTLAVARGPETGGPSLIGLVALYDPPRPDAGKLIAELRASGVAVKMLTGDALAVASEVAHDVGLPNIRRMADLKAEIAKSEHANTGIATDGGTTADRKAASKTSDMMDFAGIARATDNVHPSKKPETWNIGGFIMVSVTLGIVMVAETLLFLRIGWSHFGLSTNNNALATFSFLLLLYFAEFSVVSTRERRWFGASMPGKPLVAALTADALIGTLLTRVGIPGLMPLPWGETFAIFAWAAVSCLVINDAIKVAMIRWRVPTAAA